MTRALKVLPATVLALLCACQSVPQGPTVTAQPGEARSPEDFRADDVACRQYASDPAADDRSVLVAGGKEGSLIDGTDSAQYAGLGEERRYNRAYIRCMYLRGDRVPLLARERWPAPRSKWPPDPEEYFHPLQR